MRQPPWFRDAALLIGGTAAFLALVVALRAIENHNPTTAALVFLLVILGVATISPMWVAIVLSAGATLALNYFFLPPLGAFQIADPHNWVALATFLTVGVIASQLSTAAQARAREAVDRRNEVTRLFDLSRDILLTSDSAGAIEAVARHIARRFEMTSLAICVPGSGGWALHQGSQRRIDPAQDQLSLVLARAGGTLEFDARQRTYGGHATTTGPDGGEIHLVPLRVGVHAVGVLATPAGALEPGTLDAVGGVAAIAIERTQLLRERSAAEVVRQRADLASALLASLSHDLRTPMTAIRVAVENLQETASAQERATQADIAVGELTRLDHLFEDILDMARIDSNTITAEPQWVTSADIVDAAVAHLGRALDHHRLIVDADDTTLVRIDPRLTSSALAHLVENAVRYSPSGGRIEIRGAVDTEGLRLAVTDAGAGLDASEIGQLFQPFFRGRVGRATPGTGMGLAITRGLLAAEGGRVWAEQPDGTGARFCIAVPGPSRPAAAA